MVDFKYKPDGDTLKGVYERQYFLRGIRGPVGSGKSVGCCVEVFRRALEQKKSPKTENESHDGLLYETQTHSYELQLLKHGLTGFQKMTGENLLGQSPTPTTSKKVKSS